MPEEPDEADRALELLRTVVAASGVTRQEIDKRLKGARGYTSLVLTGGIKLRFDHIVNILQAVNVERRAFFQALYPPPSRGAQRDEALSVLEMLYRKLSEEPVEPAGSQTDDELASLVETTVRRVLAEERSRQRAGVGARRRTRG